MEELESDLGVEFKHGMFGYDHKVNKTLQKTKSRMKVLEKGVCYPGSKNYKKTAIREINVHDL